MTAASGSEAFSAPRIPVSGTFNFRDLGGHRTADGRRIATGRLFRADGLGRLDDSSHTLMSQLGIRSVVDLREEREVHHLPDALGAGLFEYAHMPLLGNRYMPLDPQSPHRLVLADHSLPGLYSAMIEGSGALFTQVITRLAEQEQGASVFHCSAGKDRTGMIAAFVLTLAGVRRDDVIADYSLTEQYLGEDFLRALGRDVASAGIAERNIMATAARPEWMADVLDRLDREFDGVEGYLAHHGLSDDVAVRLRERLVVDAAADEG
ncbi:tyrosine-protein phosphatase [Brevibacterium album]|uniref:tyrosine-protein phosphatase n=1 Tax=Brevibacterium album TaxID=417948 RepID=UPI000413C9C3|nr:tyrosine-protein phosphatase [Brevibacterium album]